MPIEMTVVAGHRPRLELDSVSEDVVTAMTEAMDWCQANADGRLEAKFASQAEAENFLHEARSWGYHQDPRVTVTGNVTKNGAVRFRLAVKASA